ncbi:MAG: Uma2 family endonuclease [Isosphaeraceae bacterium]
MATVTLTTPEATAGDQRVVMRGVGWRGYLTLLRLRGERPRPRMVYLDGDVSLISPDFAHESLKKRLGLLVMVVVEQLDIPCLASGSTTLRRKKKKGGAEADESFYLTNLEPILAKKGKENIHLRLDPPPDLVIEAVNTHEADEAVEVWRRFGVPEVWVCVEDGLVILTLQPNGRDAESPNSRAIPVLTASEIFGWVTKETPGTDTDWIRELRRWVAGPLAERHRRAGEKSAEAP